MYPAPFNGDCLYFGGLLVIMVAVAEGLKTADLIMYPDPLIALIALIALIGIAGTGKELS